MCFLQTAHLDTPLPLLHGVHWGNSYSGNDFSGESDWATTKMAHYVQKVQQPQKCPLVVQGKQQHVSVWLKRLFHVWLSSISGNGLGAFLDSLGWPHRNQSGNLNKLLPAATCSITTDVNLHDRGCLTARELKVWLWLMKHSKCCKYHTSSYCDIKKTSSCKSRNKITTNCLEKTQAEAQSSGSILGEK